VGALGSLGFVKVGNADPTFVSFCCPAHSAALGINNKGQVVGHALVDAGPWRAFTWLNGTISGLQHLPDAPFSGESAALAINESGLIVGWVHPTGGHQTAVLWENGVTKKLKE
jgi:probable HAF family extracellular repeat protein